MAVVAGPQITLTTPGGIVRVTAFYEDATGAPARVDTLNTTGRAYRVTLRLADGSRQISAVIQAGSNSINVPPNVASRIDLRLYGDEPGELPPPNPTAWVLEASI